MCYDQQLRFDVFLLFSTSQQAWQQLSSSHRRALPPKLIEDQNSSGSG
jgi:hypothetical protein